jgi:hypothetical protein
VTRRQALLLRAFAVWTVFIWVVLVKNIYNDHTARATASFKAVHYTLAVISLSFAIGAWRVVTAVAGRRATRHPGGPAREVAEHR